MNNVSAPKVTLSNGAEINRNPSADYVKFHIIEKPNPNSKSIEIKTPGKSFWIYREVIGNSANATVGQICDPTAVDGQSSKLFEEILKFKGGVEDPANTIGARFCDIGISIGKQTIAALNQVFDRDPPLSFETFPQGFKSPERYNQKMREGVIKALFPIICFDPRSTVTTYSDAVSGVIVNTSPNKSWWIDALMGAEETPAVNSRFATTLLNELVSVVVGPKLRENIVPDGAFSNVITAVRSFLYLEERGVDHTIEERLGLPDHFENTESRYSDLLVKCGLLQVIPVIDAKTEKNSDLAPSWFAELLRLNLPHHATATTSASQHEQPHQENLGVNMTSPDETNPNPELLETKTNPDNAWGIAFSERDVQENGKIVKVGGFEIDGYEDVVKTFTGSSCVLITDKPIKLGNAATLCAAQMVNRYQMYVHLLAGKEQTELTHVCAMGFDYPIVKSFGKHLALQKLTTIMKELDEFALAKFPLVQNLWLAAYGKDPVSYTLSLGEFIATIAGYKPRSKSWGDICESFEKYLASYGNNSGLDSKKLSTAGRIPMVAWYFITEALIELGILDDYCLELVDAYPSHQLTRRGRDMLNYFNTLKNNC